MRIKSDYELWVIVLVTNNQDLTNYCVFRLHPVIEYRWKLPDTDCWKRSNPMMRPPRFWQDPTYSDARNREYFARNFFFKSHLARWIPIIFRCRIIPNYIGYDGSQQSESVVSDKLIRSELGESDKRISMRTPITHRITVGSIRSDPHRRVESDFIPVRRVPIPPVWPGYSRIASGCGCLSSCRST